ncbi:cytidine deaminase [Aliiglaciecola sp. LCG003]|uniref:cytidine deaminase n=1 Tax=Aliiglaciecola sp. LCG003 TaxID=3053655 RepID=UPI0025746C40|nr:cytidine deaminase [Aliiglaciecola sp. LCG003]WJG10895.1 cytidine deaminase [Aliiglaciecola sp. LCG003]
MKDDTQTLIEVAQKAQAFSYSPYSGFKVGSALQADNNETYAGCNVENAAYPLGQCAEASAISAMIVAGGKKISKIVIASPIDKFCPPCGGCRQKIKEFSDSDTQIIMSDKNGRTKTLSIAELLPFAFELD